MMNDTLAIGIVLFFAAVVVVVMVDTIRGR